MSVTIPYARQSLSESDIESVVNALRSDWLTQGPLVERFENAIAEYCGVKHAVAVSNATAALHLACQALDLEKGKTLWTSPITFVASANCARYCGADVDFVDIDPRTYCLSTAKLAEKLRVAAEQGKLPSIVVPVHFAGQSCDMREIHALSQQYGFKVVEDAAHASGADYLGGKVGSCEFSDAAIFSFHAIKILTTGEGGMILTNDAKLTARLQLLRTHGITRDPQLMEGEIDGPWHYQQVELGEHYRITDFQCALGTSQLQRLDEFIVRRRKIAAIYDEAFADLPVILPWQHPDTNSSWHVYVVQVDEEKAGKSRRQIFDELRVAGLGVNVHYIPVHKQPYYQRLGFKMGDFPEAEKYYARTITLPLYPGMLDQDVEQVVTSVRRAFRS